jgi:chloramphenicol 3-O-phosphotransferase
MALSGTPILFVAVRCPVERAIKREHQRGHQESFIAEAST